MKSTCSTHERSSNRTQVANTHALRAFTGGGRRGSARAGRAARIRLALPDAPANLPGPIGAAGFMAGSACFMAGAACFVAGSAVVILHGERPAP